MSSFKSHRSADKKSAGSASSLSSSKDSLNDTRSTKSRSSFGGTSLKSSTPSYKGKRQSINAKRRSNDAKPFGQLKDVTKRTNGPASCNSTPSKPNSQTSHDSVRRIVQEEGRTARNLVAYSVPANQTSSKSAPPKSGIPRSPRKSSRSDESPVPKKAEDTGSVKSAGSRPASSIGGKRTDMRSRYWAFLFDNLKRAVDEIYQTCESDESVNECKEVIMILEQCTKDFQALINQWNVMKTYEDLEESGQRPISLAWEVRKTSPGKLHLPRDTSCPSPSQLFSPSAPTASSASNGVKAAMSGRVMLPPRFPAGPPPLGSGAPSLGSWADRVKGRAVLASEIEAEMLKSLSESLGGSEDVSSGMGSQPHGSAQTSQCVSENPKTTELSIDLGDTVDGWERAKRQRSKVSPSSRASNSSRGSGKKSRPNTADKLGPQGDSRKSVRGAAVTGRRSLVTKSHPSNANSTPSIASSSTSSQRRENISIHKLKATTSQPVVASRTPVSRTISAPHVTAEPMTLRCDTTSVKPPHTRKSDLNDNLLVVASETGSAYKTASNDAHKPKDNQNVTNITTGDAIPRVVQSAANQSAANQSATNLSAASQSAASQSTASQSVPCETVDVNEEEVLEMTLKHTENQAPIDPRLDTEHISENDPELQERDAAIMSVEKEEQTYLQEIEKTEMEELPADFQIPDTDEETPDQSLNRMSARKLPIEELNESNTASMDWDALTARFEVEAERRKILGLTWADMEDGEGKTPGRGAHMHEKLSSPSRKRSIQETKKRYEEKQARAAKLRDKFRKEKAEKLVLLTTKVEEVRGLKNTLISQKKNYIERKLQEAEEKRKLQLSMKVRKAHEEENKANEIAFINNLSSQNKKLDILNKHQDVEARLADRHEQWQRKMDEKAAKEAAVEERRKVLDAERIARLEEMQNKRRIKEEKIEKMNLEKDKERTEAAKTKEKEHKDRIEHLEKQHQAHIEELQKKIEHKQSESTRRHNEVLQGIREKAFIMIVLKHSTEDHSEAPKLEPYETKKMCTVCKILIPSEVHLQSHLRGQNHQQQFKSAAGKSLSKNDIESFNLRHIQDVPHDYVDPKEEEVRKRFQLLRKKAKKLKSRMQSRGNEFVANLALRQETTDSLHKTKLNKAVKDVNKFIQAQERGPWPQNKVLAVDRALNEVGRIFDKRSDQVQKDQLACRICGGINAFICLLNLLQQETTIHQYPKTFSNACQGIRLACRSCFENCHFLLFSNRISVLIDLLVTRLQMMVDDVESQQTNGDFENITQPITETRHIKIDGAATSLIHCLSTVLSTLASTHPQNKATDAMADRPGTDAFTSRIMDVLSYMIIEGVVDKLYRLYNHVRGSVEQDIELFPFLQYSINLLAAMTKHIPRKNAGMFESPVRDPTPLMQTLEDIELAGTMSLLYGMLLHNVPVRGEVEKPPELSPNTLSVTLAGLRFINQVSTMDYELVQRVVGAEGISLEWRHIISYLIWYCTYYTQTEILHEAILSIGYYTVLNEDNQSHITQMVVQSGQSPTILQQLCSLPFSYFSDPTLVGILYPTLIACCFRSDLNKVVLEQELSSQLLSHFLEVSTLELKEKSENSSSSRPVTVSDGRMSLAQRFPQSLWIKAQEYFTLESQSHLDF